MAIGDLATASSDTTGTSLTYAHSVAGSSDLCLWVCCDDWRNTSFADPSDVTYAGAALTKISNYAGGADNKNMVSLWRRIAPTTGSNNVVVTHAQSHDITAMSISYSGVDQTTPNDTPVQNDTVVTNPSHSVTSETGDHVVSFVGGWGVGGGFTAGGGLTERLENNNGNGINSMAVGDAVGAASVTASWTMGAGADGHGLMSFNVNQATGGAAVASFLPRRFPLRALIGR